MWNELVMVIKYDKVSQEDKDHARLLLGQLNTAGGSHLMRKEITYFLEDMADKYGTIPTKVTLEQELADVLAEQEEFRAQWRDKPKCREDIIMISNRLHQFFLQIKNLNERIAKY